MTITNNSNLNEKDEHFIDNIAPIDNKGDDFSHIDWISLANHRLSDEFMTNAILEDQSIDWSLLNQ